MLQWALGIVGLAISIPAIFGAMITGGAVLGHFWLGERVSRRSMAAIGLLLASLVLLGTGGRIGRIFGKRVGRRLAKPALADRRRGGGRFGRDRCSRS